MLGIRLTGAVLAAVCMSLLGQAMAKTLKCRIQLLEEIYRGLLMLHQEMEYLKTPLEEAMQRAGQSLAQPLSSFFREAGRRLEELPGSPFFTVWEEMTQRYLKDMQLRQEDLQLWLQLGMQLETLQAEGNGQLLEVYEQRFAALTDQARADYAGKAQLYQKLGLLGGIFLVILFL